MLLDFSTQAKKPAAAKNAKKALQISEVNFGEEYDEVEGSWLVQGISLAEEKKKNASTEPDGFLDTSGNTTLDDQISSVIRNGCNKLAWRGAEVSDFVHVNAMLRCANIFGDCGNMKDRF